MACEASRVNQSQSSWSSRRRAASGEERKLLTFRSMFSIATRTLTPDAASRRAAISRSNRR